MLASGIFSIGALLLTVSGIAKIVDPEPTRGALAAMRLPSGTVPVVTLGSVELALGVLAMLDARPSVAVGVALMYAGFTGFVLVALRRDVPVQSCGCFGRSDTPPSIAHVIVDGSIAAAAVVAALTRPAGMVELMTGDLLIGAVYAAFAALGTWLLYLVLAELPRTLASAGVHR